MEEYASAFFILVKRGMQIDNLKRTERITDISIPHMKSHQSKNIIKQIVKSTRDEKPVTIKDIEKDRERLRDKLKRKII